MELQRPAAALWMGFSFLAERASWTPLIANSGYCMGFLIVILGRQQLFTENTLTVELPVLLHEDWRLVFRAWLWGGVAGGKSCGHIVVRVGLGGFNHIVVVRRRCFT
ncbi:MAG: formate/nitrite transporter family protein [Candidatus Acidiferrum sp.]